MRGGILDVWSPGSDAPVRVEFFGDTVDSIREFDAETQLSTGQLKEVEIAPMRELSVTADDFRLWAEMARERWSDERYARSLRDRTVYADEGEALSPGAGPRRLRTDEAIEAVQRGAGEKRRLSERFSVLARLAPTPREVRRRVVTGRFGEANHRLGVCLKRALLARFLPDFRTACPR